MGQSIAHSDPSERRALLRRFLGALGEALVYAASRSEDQGAAAALDGFARLTRSIDPMSDWPDRDVSLARVPVCRFWDAALDAGARSAASPLTSALRALGPSLSWTQNPNYRRQPPGPAFLENYGYAVIAGPADGPPGLALDPRLAVGVLLLGPGTLYPRHEHPAVEIYYTLTSEGEWWKGAGPWRREPTATAIYHAPNVPHATWAGSSPLLAVYLWRGALATHARLTLAC
jgi:quercetin dioxygenase-like cupin family protein